MSRKKFNQWKSNEEKTKRKPNQQHIKSRDRKKWEQNSCCMIGHKAYTLSNLVRFFIIPLFIQQQQQTSSKKNNELDFYFG